MIAGLTREREVLNREIDEDRMDSAEAGFLLGYELDAYETIEGKV